MSVRGCLWTAFLIGMLCLHRADAAEVPSFETQAEGPYHIKADSLSYDDVTKTYVARGHVTVTHANQSLWADAVDFNPETKEAVAWGHVRFSSGEDWLTGARVEIDFDRGVGTVYDGLLFISESHFYVHGKKLEKTGENSYHVQDVRLTSCDGANPAWEVTGKDLDVTVEGYGTVTHAALKAKSIPVLYTPFFLFPAKTKRQTGLLVPNVYYSNRDGFEYNQPFFWAISESSDATFYEHYMAYRGFKHGAEYRYVLSPESKGALMYDFLYDRQIDDGTAAADSSGYHYEGFRGDSVDRLNRKRWWFRTKSDQSLPAGLTAKLDLDVVSDQDYLREFDTGYASFEDSDDYFLDEFGRELDDKEDAVRLNQLNLNRSWNHFNLNTDFQWYDDVIIRNEDLPDPTLQSLPTISLTGSKHTLLDTPFYYDLESFYDHSWRDAGTRGYEADLHPRLYYPTTVFEHFDFEPSVGVRETLWQAEEYEPRDAGKLEDQVRSRELYDLQGDLSTEISRVFDTGGTTIEKVRHAIQPQLTYEYIPTLEQEDLPDFVEVVERSNLLTYSITNSFTAKIIERGRRSRSEAQSAPGMERPRAYLYKDFCRIKFSQSYDILKARRKVETGERRPFSNVLAEVEITPFTCLSLDGDLRWSPYDGEYKGYNALVELCDGRGDSASVDYLYTQAGAEAGADPDPDPDPDVEGKKSVLTKLFVRLLDPISAYWENERNLQDGQEVKTEVGCIYKAQCWSFQVSYTHDRTTESREYFFQIGLTGLGEFELGRYRPDTGEDTWQKKG